jgi:uncharacterized protein (DUF302 family)
VPAPGRHGQVQWSLPERAVRLGGDAFRHDACRIMAMEVIRVEYGRTIELDLPYAEVVPRVKEAFKAQGFGTLTEIDVRATLKEKLGEDMEPYVILGGCHPELAHKTLDIDRDSGLLLPCNVVAREKDGGPSSRPSTPRSWSRCRRTTSSDRSPTRPPGGSIERSPRCGHEAEVDPGSPTVARRARPDRAVVEAAFSGPGQLEAAHHQGNSSAWLPCRLSASAV